MSLPAAPSQLLDMAQPQRPRRGFSAADLWKCKLGGGVIGLLLNHNNMLLHRWADGKRALQWAALGPSGGGYGLVAVLQRERGLRGWDECELRARRALSEGRCLLSACEPV